MCIQKHLKTVSAFDLARPDLHAVETHFAAFTHFDLAGLDTHAEANRSMSLVWSFTLDRTGNPACLLLCGNNFGAGKILVHCRRGEGSLHKLALDSAVAMLLLECGLTAAERLRPSAPHQQANMHQHNIDSIAVDTAMLSIICDRKGSACMQKCNRRSPKVRHDLPIHLPLGVDD